VVVGVLLVVALGGFVSGGSSLPSPGSPSSARLGLYAFILATQWGLLALVAWGVRRAGTGLSELIEPLPTRASRHAAHAALGVVAFAAWMAIQGPSRPRCARAPRTCAR
jgi:hypothetical protein